MTACLRCVEALQRGDRWCALLLIAVAMIPAVFISWHPLFRGAMSYRWSWARSSASARSGAARIR